LNQIYQEDFKKIILIKNKNFINNVQIIKILDKLKIFYYLKNKRFKLKKKKIIKNLIFLEDFFLFQFKLNFLKWL